MSNDGDGNGGDGHGKPAIPIAEIVNLADLFATHCQIENRGEYFRLIFSTEAVVPGTGTVENELVPSARVVMTPSGLMELAEAILAFYMRRQG
jgi:hypothetical protein